MQSVNEARISLPSGGRVSIIETSREIPSVEKTGQAIPLEVRHRLRKSREIEAALQREAGEVFGLPELEMV
jgi:hypothetical protein